MLESSPCVSVLVHVCDSRGACRSVAERERKSPRRQPSAQVAIECHISTQAWWLLRAVVSQVARLGGRDADVPVSVAIALCGSSNGYIEG